MTYKTENSQKTPKKCPHCGRQDELFLFREGSKSGISCGHCGSFGPLADTDSALGEDMQWNMAVKLWNKRLSKPEVDKRGNLVDFFR